ncbi:hypothetical protein MZM54_21125 [[Brevibacterium] frigoritolerans]|nr:hypothetical protein [Peribacillus frigoritolerans]
MKITIEEDMFNVYQWFNKSEALKIIDGVLPKLSALSIDGIEGNDFEDKLDFLEKAENIVKEKLQPILSKRNYKFYLFVADQIESPSSKVTMYKKVWKMLASSWKIDDFRCGPEVIIRVNNDSFFVSVAEIKMSDLNTALRLQHSNICECVVFASHKKGILEVEFIKTFFETSFNPEKRLPKFIEHNDTADYFNLFFKYCPQGDIIVRIGDSSEEMALDLIFNKEVFNILS